MEAGAGERAPTSWPAGGDARGRHLESSPALRMVASGAAVPPSSDRAVARAEYFLRLHLEERVGLDQVAAYAGVSKFTLIRRFRRRHDLSVMAYLIGIRLERAAALLTQGMSCAGAAAAAGFCDQSHMNRWFRRAFGVAPSTMKPDVARPPCVGQCP